MNRKGIVPLFTIMVAVTILILAIALTPAIKEFVDIARNDTQVDSIGLGCDNSTITGNETTGDFASANCVAVDLFTPMFIAVMMAIAGAIIGAKIIIGEA